MFVANVSEDGFENNPFLDRLKAFAQAQNAPVVAICAKIEAELSEMDDADRLEFLKELGQDEPGLNRLIPKLSRNSPSEPAAAASLNGDIQAAMAEHVISSNSEELQALRKALASGNHPALKNIAHKLKGTAYLLNAKHLLELCVGLEELLAKAADAQQVAHAVTRLEQALRDLNQSLQVH